MAPPPLPLLILLLLSPLATPSGDADALLALKRAVDHTDSLPWRREAASDMCALWRGVKECSPDGRVTKLVLEFLNLTGDLPTDALSPLDQLRVLSLKSNALSGAIPDLSPLANLKSLYLSNNRFTGGVPAAIAGLHRIKGVYLAGNRLSGKIPTSFAAIPRLYALLLQDNELEGEIPAFDQRDLMYFNVSGNDLSGEIPATAALARFNASSFLGNPRLCGLQTRRQCASAAASAPSPGSDLNVTLPAPASRHHHSKKVVKIVAGAVAGSVFLAICVIALALLLCRRGVRARGVGKSAGVEAGPSAAAGGEGGKRGFIWEREEGRLEFCGGAGGEMYGFEELLRASAETLGRGTVGSTYKAVMETGFIVTVKRLREQAAWSPQEFAQRMEELGRLRHLNLVPLRAYFQAKEERLLVYDYFPNGSLFSLVHGSRSPGSGKPLHWTSCLKIAEDVVAGLLFLHQSGAVHGNLKSSNVLLGSDFESCLTDYALLPYLYSDTDAASDATPASALFSRAPESRHPRKPVFSPPSDVYSFGVLLLELLTGKTPFQDLVEQHGADIPRWVRSVREESGESGGEDPASGNGNDASDEKLAALLNIAITCVTVAPEGRPVTKEVLKMVREARAEAMVSSNSSDHSPGRWSDTVQSLPREYGSERLSSAERD